MSTSMIEFLILTLLLLSVNLSLGDSNCWRRKDYHRFIFTGRVNNATVKCAQQYQWTVNEYCCYDRYDSLDINPFCCYSETYKLLIGVGIICAMILGSALFVFLCWLYNMPHYILKFLTCGKFSLNDYMKKAKMTGPYVDPSFYAGEPFWTSGGSEYSHYPLRPMPPKIFYPVPAKVDLRRWSNQRHAPTQTPLFIVASRQFTRNPYSARPNERGSASSSTSAVEGMNSSRRSSISSCVYDSNAHRMIPPAAYGFKVHIGKRQQKSLETILDEVDAATELLEALKTFDEKSDKNFLIPKVKEETQWELELDREDETNGMTQSLSDRAQWKDVEQEYLEIPIEESSTFPVPVHRQPSPPHQLDVTKLSAQSQRTLSGTLCRRNHMRGGSVDSTCSAFTLESILEEHNQSSHRQPNQSTPHPTQFASRSGSTYSGNIPGYIPEESDLDKNDRARKLLGTA